LVAREADIPQQSMIKPRQGATLPPAFIPPHQPVGEGGECRPDGKFWPGVSAACPPHSIDELISLCHHDPPAAAAKDDRHARPSPGRSLRRRPKRLIL
jgi:hypothetical protein